jgi:biotin carboxylase
VTRRVLLVSTTTGYQLRSFGEAAAELGIALLFATDRCHSLDDPWRDAAVAVRFHEEEQSVGAVLRALDNQPVAGVLAVGDRPVVLAARLARGLGCRGNDPDAARASADKALARARFAAAGLHVPWYVHTAIDADREALKARVAYPAVVKPVMLSGSRGVIRVNSPAELDAALDRLSALLSRPEIRALRTGAEGQLIVEGFVEGHEYAVEGLLSAGRFRPLALFDKPDPLDGPFFEETIYVTPPPSLSAAAGQAMYEEIARAAAALGLTHGPVHAECRVNPRGVFVLEVAARPIGGLCSRILRFERPGRPGSISLEHLLLQHAVGDDVADWQREARAAAVMMMPIPRRGIFKRVTGEEQAQAVDGVEEIRITAKPDQLLEPLPEAGSYLGFIFARADTAAGAERAVRDSHRRLTFVVDPAIDVAARSG